LIPVSFLGIYLLGDQVAGELSMRASEQCPCHHSFKRLLTHPISFILSSSFNFWQDRNGKVIF